jgi:hypothetical protein
MIILIKLDAAQIHEEPRVRRRVARVAYGMTPCPFNPPPTSDDLPSGTFDASRGRGAVSPYRNHYSQRPGAIMCRLDAWSFKRSLVDLLVRVSGERESRCAYFQAIS